MAETGGTVIPRLRVVFLAGLLPALAVLISSCGSASETALPVLATPKPAPSEIAVETDPAATEEPDAQTVSDDTSLIRVVSSELGNRYPDALSFFLVAESAVPITDLRLFYRSRGSESYTMEPVDFLQSDTVTAVYVWDTSQFTVPPSTPLVYYWEFVDELGNRQASPELTVNYEDQRFGWKELTDSELTIRWYEGGTEFGEIIFDAARQALDQLKTDTGLQLGFPVIVLIYANDADFASWHFHVEDWVGGQAFPAIGVTTQIIRPGYGEFWIRDVIPHEIAHLFFYQQVNTNLSSWPSWLDEGFAQLYEIDDKTPALRRVEAAALDGSLIPLRHLSGHFGSAIEQVRLGYDQSLSAVVFLRENWTPSQLKALIETIRGGSSFDRALQTVLGLSFEEFEAGWITWLGVPTTPAPSPTPFPTFGVIGAQPTLEVEPSETQTP